MNPWDIKYSSDDYFYGTDPNEFLRSNINYFRPGMSVLCLAEGEGRNAVFLAENGMQVTAIDGSSVGLAKMKKLAALKKLSVMAMTCDLGNYTVEPNSWDAIVSIWCHVPQILRRKLHADVVGGLKPGGIFLLEAYRPKQLDYKTGGPSDSNLMMTLPALEEELAGLKILLGHEIEREVYEGKGHSGLSAVVQVIGRK